MIELYDRADDSPDNDAVLLDEQFYTLTYK
jgi:hypothetical protein